MRGRKVGGRRRASCEREKRREERESEREITWGVEGGPKKREGTV